MVERSTFSKGEKIVAEFLSRKNVKIFQVILKTPIISTGSSQATEDFLPACIWIWEFNCASCHS